MAQGNDRLETFFQLVDTKCFESSEPMTNTSTARVDIGGLDPDQFAVNGAVQGVGTDGDVVRINYDTDGLNKASADDESGKVSQKTWSSILIRIVSSDDARDEDTRVSIEKCKIDSSVQVDSEGDCWGTTSVTCSGTDLYDFLEPAQVTSIQAAFPKGNDCGVKFDANDPGKKSSLKIKLKAKKNTDSCFLQGPPS